MAFTLEARVSILERTVSDEIRERVKMSKDIVNLRELVEGHSKAQLRAIQALADTQSEHTRDIRGIRQKVDRMAPKVDSIESQMHGMQLRMGNLDGRMSTIETRIGAVETRMDGLDTRMSSLETKVERLDAKVEGLDTRMGSLETKVEGLDAKVEGLDAKIGTLDTKIDTVAVRLDGKIDALAGQVSTIIDLLNQGR